MDVVRGSHPQKISVYNINRATVRPSNNPRMHRRMAPFIAGKAEEWVIKVLAFSSHKDRISHFQEIAFITDFVYTS